MPESLRYEELVRRNVVGLGHKGGSSGDILGPYVQGRTHCPSVGTLHCHLPEVYPGDRAESAHQGLGRYRPAPAPGAGEASSHQPGVCPEQSLHLTLTCPFPMQEQHVPFDIHTYGDQLVFPVLPA